MSDEQPGADAKLMGDVMQIANIVHRVEQERDRATALHALIAGVSASVGLMDMLTIEDSEWFGLRLTDLIREAAERKRRIETERN